MSAPRIHVDPTLPPAQFNAELLAASRLARLERVARRLRVKRAEEGFRRMGYEADEIGAMVKLHVHGVAR